MKRTRFRGTSESMTRKRIPTSRPAANLVDRWKAPVAEERLLSQIKRIVVGKPIHSNLAHHERLSRTTGLAVLSSDALSSVAYATVYPLTMLLRIVTVQVLILIFCR